MFANKKNSAKCETFDKPKCKTISIHDKYLQFENKDKRPPMDTFFYRSKSIK